MRKQKNKVIFKAQYIKCPMQSVMGTYRKEAISNRSKTKIRNGTYQGFKTLSGCHPEKKQEERVSDKGKGMSGT